MGWLLAIIFAILFFEKNSIVKAQNIKIRDLKKQIEELKESKLNNLIMPEEMANPNDNFEKIENKTEIAVTQTAKIDEEKKAITRPVEVKENVGNLNTTNKEKNKRENTLSSIDKKNNNILLTGSILVVLSAIVFLTSTWYTIPNIVKTLGLVLFIGIFLGSSKIAKDKFNLEKTSRTFFYIAMAYIPICLIGISFFGLFGEYLSIRGDGRGLYLALVSTFLALMYYVVSKRYKSNGIFVGSVISQYSAVIAFTTIIETNFTFICLALLLYNIIVILLTNDNISKLLTNISLYTISIAFLLYFGVLYFDFKYGFAEIITILIMAINYFVSYQKYKAKIDYILLNVVSLIFGNCIVAYKGFAINEEFKVVLNFIWFAIIYILINSYVQDKSKLEITSIILMIWILQFVYNIETTFVKYYMIGFVECIILTYCYKRKLFSKYNLKTVLYVAYFLLGNLFIWDNKIGDFTYLLWNGIYSLGALRIKDEKIKESISLISHIGIMLSIINLYYCNAESLVTCVAFLVLMLIYFITYIKTNKNYIFKYAIYIALFFECLSISLYLKLGIEYYIMPVLSLGITTIEYMFKDKIKDQYFENAILLMYGLSYCSLTQTTCLISIVLDLIISGILLYKSYLQNKNLNNTVLALVGNFIVLYYFECKYLMLILGIALTIMSLLKLDKKNEITIGSAIYLAYFAFCFDVKLVTYVIAFAWGISHLYIRKENQKIFRIITYISFALIYYEILVMLGLNEYVSAIMLCVEFMSILVFKNIISEKENQEGIKYLIYGLIYLICLASYNGIVDGMLTVGIMILGVFYSYNKKDGEKVIVNLVFIIINAFALTRAFWLSIPWWIYLLIVGLVLIGFAIRNEANEKKEKITASSAIKKFKDKIEKR